MVSELGSASSSSSAASKRKATTSVNEKSAKKPRAPSKSNGKSKETNQESSESWPEYFNALFKVYKALNTVLAFCSSRKHMATTFNGIRASVEALLKEPLDLVKVAEIKALLPNLIKFGYVSKSDLQIHGIPYQSGRSKSPDYSPFPHSSSPSEADTQVLVLEFAENSRGKKEPSRFTFTLPPALTPTAMKKLIDTRNQRFKAAVDELLAATPTTEDPVALLQAAGRDHIPVNTSWHTEDDDNDPKDVPSSDDRPTIDAVITDIQERRWYKGQIVMRKVADEIKGREGFLDPPLSETISEALRKSRSITSLYSHQAEAINALHKGKHVIVSTSTASGKSVIYQVPMLRFLEEDHDSTVMLIYPTKALAQDQKGAAEQLMSACAGLEHLQVATYDGDTPQEKRRSVRDNVSVIFTNFDMIHASILPHEELWRRFLQCLKLVVVDELHYYADLFGSHVAQVIRRFRRVCAAVGNRKVQFVSCSATIRRPLQHMQAIFGVDDIQEVTDDGAPAGRKDFLVWNPPLKDPKAPLLGRVSSMVEATGVMRFLMKRGIRVILFCKIRKVCELAMKTLRTDLSADGRLDIIDRVMSYRGGYSPQDRRMIEHEAFLGRLLGIVATNALELGIDIGALDAVIILGFPIGGIASLRQQAGRAGRRSRDALAVYVADLLPVDSYYVENPDELFNRPIDDLIIDLESKMILEAHLQCAGVEMPISFEDEVYFGPLIKEICQTQLVKDKDGWYHTHPKFMPYPAKHVSLRGMEEERYVLLDVTKLDRGGPARIIEEIEVSRALFEVFEGAVYIHQGITFVINQVSHDSMVARLIRADVNWITSPRDFTDVDALQTYRIREIKGLAESTTAELAFYGRAEVRTVIFGYFKLRNGMIIDSVDIDTLPWIRETVGFWIDVPKSTLDLMLAKNINSAEAIHAAEHAILNRFAMSADLKTECKAAEKEYKTTESTRKRPARLIFYDVPGKSGGVAAKAFDHISDLVRSAYQTTVACACTTGCTQCVLSASCKEKSLVTSKLGAELVLQSVLGIPINPDDVRGQGGLDNFDTIIAATPVPSRIHIDIEKD